MCPLVPLFLQASLLFGCSVEAGKMPQGTVAPVSVREAKTRDEIKRSLGELGELGASVAVMGRVQNVLQRGLAENQVDAGKGSTINLLAQSDADTVTFAEDAPERFEYRLNNSTTFGLRTRSGGRVEVILTGTLDDTSDRMKIKDAKLEVLHESTKAK